MSEQTLLIGDIGGTNARFALANSDVPGFSAQEVLECATYATADHAIREYLESAGAGAPDAICLAAAGPIVNERVRFTNNPWTISAASNEKRTEPQWHWPVYRVMPRAPPCVPRPR